MASYINEVNNDLGQSPKHITTDFKESYSIYKAEEQNRQILASLQDALRQHFNDPTITIQFSDSRSTQHWIFYANSRQHDYRYCIQISMYELTVSKFTPIETCYNKIIKEINMRQSNLTSGVPS